jgi:hypothetical protein
VQQAPRGRLDRSNDVEPIGAGPEGDGGIVIADLGLYLAHLVGGDVRGIARHKVKPAVELRKCVGNVTLVQGDRQSVVFGVAFGPGKRARIELDSVHHCLRHLGCQRECDGAGTGAQIDTQGMGDAGSQQFLEPVYSPLNDPRRLRLRHENPRSDQQIEASKADLAQQVLERLAPAPTLDQSLERSAATRFRNVLGDVINK